MAMRTIRCYRLAEIALFVLLTFAASWLSAWALHSVLGIHARDSVLTRLLAASALYALTMGWQPIAALYIVRAVFRDRSRLDDALRSAPPRVIALGALFAIALCAFAALIASLLRDAGLQLVVASPYAPEPHLSALPPSWELSVMLLFALVATLACVWFQAWGEEVAWRGYFLAHLMDLLGPWRGLLMHGVVWGVWYAPVIMLAAQPDELVLTPALAFAVSCMLLGVLLAWLRLASGSIVPVVVANVTVTLAAGLPYAIHGIDPGVRGALFGPAGWLVMVISAVCWALTRLRSTVKVPHTRQSDMPSTSTRVSRGPQAASLASR